jgi:Glycosyl transferases group 1
MQGGTVSALEASDQGVAYASAHAPTRVVHAVGRLTDSVFRFVGPATDALTQLGRHQVVLALEDPHNRHLSEHFPRNVEVVTLPLDRNPLRRWQRWLDAFRHISSQGPIETVHLHGFIPSALVAPLFSRGVGTHLVYSPHGSRSHKRATVIQFTASLIARPWLRFVPQHSVVSMPSEARVLSRWSGPEVRLVEVPVDAAYQEVEVQKAHHPLVVGGVHDDPSHSASRFAQLAVLLGNGDHGLAFNWIGPVDSESQQRMTAAEVGIFSGRGSVERARRLAAGWVFLCPVAIHGFPGHIAEAMACGLPVVALDCPVHRDMITDGETGFLCTTDEEMLTRVAELIASPERRRQIGHAARDMARTRFAAGRFKQELLETYPSARS